MSTSSGACVARARLHARFGNPMPTNTTSPSLSSRAARTAINSLSVYAAASEAIVDSLADARLGGQPLDCRRSQFVEILGPAGDAVDPLEQPCVHALRIARDLIPAHIEVVVAIVIALRVRRMR